MGDTRLVLTFFAIFATAMKTSTKFGLALACILLLTAACGPRKEGLRNGDLIFVGLPFGYSSEESSADAAISSATGVEGQLNLIHVAIAETKADSIWIIDATLAHGVDRHPLDTFLKDFTLRDGSYPEFIIKRVKGADAEQAVQRAKAFCGRKYDVRFDPDNEDLYCSELVQKCYLDASGAPLFESEPMNFKAPDCTFPPYWERLFEKLGEEIPQGLPGTNPQRMSQAGCLTDVPFPLLTAPSR